MKKILFLCLTFLLLLSLLCVTGHAEEIEKAPVTEAVTDEAAPDEGATADTATGALAAFFTENADTLLGLLTLVGSLLVAFLYKTGLLPMLRAGLSALADTLSKSRDATEAFTASASENIRRIEAQTEPILAAVTECEAIIRKLEARLGTMETALADGERAREDTAAILRTETELFYELLHSVNLPEAQKEAMSESYYRLKRALEAKE